MYRHCFNKGLNYYEFPELKEEYNFTISYNTVVELNCQQNEGFNNCKNFTMWKQVRLLQFEQEWKYYKLKTIEYMTIGARVKLLQFEHKWNYYNLSTSEITTIWVQVKLLQPEHE